MKKPYKILPCPWCEFRGIKLSLYPWGDYKIQCGYCGQQILPAPTKHRPGSVDRAISTWNVAVKPRISDFGVVGYHPGVKSPARRILASAVEL